MRWRRARVCAIYGRIGVTIEADYRKSQELLHEKRSTSPMWQARHRLTSKSMYKMQETSIDPVSVPVFTAPKCFEVVAPIPTGLLRWTSYV